MTVQLKRYIARNGNIPCKLAVFDILIQRYCSRTYLISLIKSVADIAERIPLITYVINRIAYNCDNLRITVIANISIV